MKNVIATIAAIAALTAPAFAGNADDQDKGEKVTPSVVTDSSGNPVTSSDGTPVTTSEYLPSDISTKQSND